MRQAAREANSVLLLVLGLIPLLVLVLVLVHAAIDTLLTPSSPLIFVNLNLVFALARAVGLVRTPGPGVLAGEPPGTSARPPAQVLARACCSDVSKQFESMHQGMQGDGAKETASARAAWLPTASGKLAAWLPGSPALPGCLADGLPGCLAASLPSSLGGEQRGVCSQNRRKPDHLAWTT